MHEVDPFVRSCHVIIIIMPIPGILPITWKLYAYPYGGIVWDFSPFDHNR